MMMRWWFGRGEKFFAPTVKRFWQPVSGSIPTIIRSFKSAVTKRINEMRQTPGEHFQRNYYEHIIRNGDELNRIRQYIADNPARWETDRENPVAGNATERYKKKDDAVEVWSGCIGRGEKFFAPTGPTSAPGHIAEYGNSDPAGSKNVYRNGQVMNRKTPDNLNAEIAHLVATIKRHFEELGA